MRLSSRLNRLEKHRREAGVCPRCDGRGWPQHFVQGPPDQDLTTRPGDPIGCDRCGRVSQARMVVIDASAPNPLEQWLAAGGVITPA